jgi:hypothetical protein
VSITTNEDQTLRVFENRVLRKISGTKTTWRRLHKEELHVLYCSPKYYMGDQEE